MFKYLQKIGRALMVPVAVLPAAAIMMGVGYWIDPTGWGTNSALAAFLIKSGGALIDNMSLLFAVGIAYGLSDDKDGSAALSGVVGFLIVTTLLAPTTVAALKGVPVEKVPFAFTKINNQFIGILVGVITASIYNKFRQVELHRALAFFSGRRLVPILTSVAMIVFSFVLLYIWPVVFGGLVGFGKSIISLGPLGAGIFGFFNRLLIPVGLHHSLNAVFWFDLANINDLGNFWQSVGEKGVTGRYMAGFFPIMMFGLVGAAAAFIKTAKPENKEKVTSIMIAAGFASFFTGVTEPLEFSFMFVAPSLYLIHALLTGLSLFIAATFQWTAGFGFSAGLVDFVLSTKVAIANKPYMLLVLGVVFFFVYYFLFTFLITKFNLNTPGREEMVEENASKSSNNSSHKERAEIIFKGLGGSENITNIDNCATRLRIEVVDTSKVDISLLKSVSSGVLTPGKTSVQVIIGPKVEFVCDELKNIK